MIYLFNNNKQLLSRNGILYEDSIITFSYTKELNSIYDMTFEVPVMTEDNENLYDRVSRASFVGFKETASRFQMYKITRDRKSTRLNSSHVSISYAVFCLKKKKNIFDMLISIWTKTASKRLLTPRI